MALREHKQATEISRANQAEKYLIGTVGEESLKESGISLHLLQIVVATRKMADKADPISATFATNPTAARALSAV